MTDARKTMALALDALHAMVNAMLDRGVHTDPEHPYRQALNFACTARNALRTALEQQAEPVMLNGLTEAETNATASVMGLTRQAEPVAWMDREGDLYKMPEIKNWAPPHTMLYTTPPQREWVGLTDEEIEKIWFYTASVKGGPFFLRFAKAIEAKLKERNNG